MSAVDSFTLTYDVLNESRTFTEGDTVTGQVKLALSKDVKVQSLFVKAKGDANVRYTRRHGDRDRTYSAHTRYFKLKQFLIEVEDTVLPKGTHVYRFSFNLPRQRMPSSFRGCHGKIVYKLEAKLSRSWRPDRTADQEIHFVSKSFPNLQALMTSQMGSTDKGAGLFSKGHVHMDVILNKGAYAAGETMAILAKVNNASSNKMTCKFSLVQEVYYRAHGDTKHQSSTILKVANDIIRPQTQQDVRGTLMIPRDQALSIQNCDILSVEYYVKAYLDISFASDPEVVFPVVIIPSDLAHPQYGQGGGAIGGPSNSDFPPALPMGPYPAGGIGGPSNRDFPPPAVAMGPYPAGGIGGPSNSDFPPPAAAMGPYPAGGIGGPSNSYFPPPVMSVGPHPASQHSGKNHSEPPPEYPGLPPHTSVGYNNPVPQQAFSYGDPYSSPSSVLHPPPTTSTFHPPPSAPQIQPPPFSALPSIAPFAPTYNLQPSAPTPSSDFLSQSDDAPPSYSLIFPSSSSENSDAK